LKQVAIEALSPPFRKTNEKRRKNSAPHGGFKYEHWNRLAVKQTKRKSNLKVKASFE
jgi:predicted secreted hydrolase